MARALVRRIECRLPLESGQPGPGLGLRQLTRGISADFATIGLIAGLVPAWRAARIDPARVLRDG